MPTDKAPFDYIIVGAGSAGCVLANRLSADPGCRVLLLEAGPMDRSPILKIPAGFAYAMSNADYDWNFEGEPEPFLRNRKLVCNRGRVVGGSSSINALCFVRGNPLDFDRWADETGDPDWSYQACLPYFKKLESYSGGGNDFRGDSGPLKVLQPTFSNPLNRVFADAASEAGYPWNADPNGEFQQGVGPMDQTIYKGLRQSASVAYLHPVRHRPNLTLVCNALVHRVLFDGKRCRGIEYSVQGETVEQLATIEVLLCAGAIGSPHILMLSGIGPGEHLQELGIPVVHPAAAVGQNLQDHSNVNVQYESRQPITATPYLRLHRKAWLGLQWMFNRSGPGATNHFEIAAYLHSNERLDRPDLQLLFFPLLADDSGKAPSQQHGFQVAISNLRSASRGELRLKSNRAGVAPSIRFNYLGQESDRTTLLNGIKITRRIFQAAAFKTYLGEELSPGSAVNDDADLELFISNKLRSTKHPCGTCRMGQGSDAVVDSRGKVHGVSGLRVVDASIMPSITSGNINAPTLMLAEKIADSIIATN
ncbi:MAG: choline dehydrogenase [Planctomycetota bacterium]|jgi:choline dehydrogenase